MIRMKEKLDWKRRTAGKKGKKHEKERKKVSDLGTIIGVTRRECCDEDLSLMSIAKKTEWMSK